MGGNEKLEEIDNRLRDLGVSDLVLNSMNLDRFERLLDHIDSMKFKMMIYEAQIRRDRDKIERLSDRINAMKLTMKTYESQLAMRGGFHK